MQSSSNTKSTINLNSPTKPKANKKIDPFGKADLELLMQEFDYAFATMGKTQTKTPVVPTEPQKTSLGKEGGDGLFLDADADVMFGYNQGNQLGLL